MGLLVTRHAVQGLATLLRPTRNTLRIGAAIDATHAVSMVGVAVLRSGETRRLAAADAGIAGGAAVEDLLLLRSGPAR
ncbi:MAG TPA: hypothetical protein VME70_07795 [Mycobacteriales bacterium]|nr:hypothetical protein [Mycobacteriales bacterium]